MNLKLTRVVFDSHGIFGTLTDHDDIAIAVTLEHSYDAKLGNGSYAPKLPNGEYKCLRGTHQLHNAPPFETFEITGVPGHTGILFHAGNFNEDSEGCVLLGRRIVPNPSGDGDMITSSKNSFLKFMDLQDGINEFTLTVL